MSDAFLSYGLTNSHRKLIKAKGGSTASWREVTPSTPQQDDQRSCGVYVVKVGLEILKKKPNS